jgi:hypothetical protein
VGDINKAGLATSFGKNHQATVYIEPSWVCWAARCWAGGEWDALVAQNRFIQNRRFGSHTSHDYDLLTCFCLQVVSKRTHTKASRRRRKECRETSLDARCMIVLRRCFAILVKVESTPSLGR